MLNSDLTNVITDLLFLANYLETRVFEQSGLPQRALIQQFFYTFAREKRLYDRIRLLDPEGREQVRVNFVHGEPQLVSDERLQDKASRYYFREAMGLQPGEIYISPLDLNIEQGVIEQPLKPVMRFAIPLFDDKGRRQAILVLNYLGECAEQFRQGRRQYRGPYPFAQLRGLLAEQSREGR